MAYRNKTFVSFDGDNDMRYYRLMCAWKQNDNIEFSFYDAHDLNSARDTSTEESIKRQLRDRLRNSKVFILLVGEKTRYLYRFVRWEIEQAIDLNLPIIAVNVNGNRQKDDERCPSILTDKLAIHISFNASILQHALENWPASHDACRQENKHGPYHYNTGVYTRLGL